MPRPMGPLDKDGFGWGTAADGSIIILAENAELARRRLTLAPGLLEALTEAMHFFPDTSRGNAVRERARTLIAAAKKGTPA